MNTQHQILNPDDVKRSSEGQLLGLRMRFPWATLPGEGIAARYASQVFNSLLLARLEAVGCTLASSGWGFPFSLSFHLFELARRSDRGFALAELHAVATKHGIAQMCFIAWYDKDEGVWRLFHPTCGEFPEPTPAEFKEDLALMASAIEAMRRNQGIENQDG